MIPKYEPRTIAEPAILQGDRIDGYARRGIALSRDAASEVLAALRRDTYELRQRGGVANLAAAEIQDRLAESILQALR